MSDDELIGETVGKKSRREAVPNSYLVDRKPPYLIEIDLLEEGMRWKKDEELKGL